MTAAEVVTSLRAAGGSIQVDGPDLLAVIPESAAHLRAELRARKAEVIRFLSAPRPSDLAEVELMTAEIRQWDYTMAVWAEARCAWKERSWGSLSKLYESQVAWAHQTGQPFAGDEQTFTVILMGLGFHVADGWVYGLIFREDAEAVTSAPAPASLSPAARWLREFLSSGPKPIPECDDAGRSVGFTRRQVFDAADEMRLDKERIGEKLHWKLNGHQEAR